MHLIGPIVKHDSVPQYGIDMKNVDRYSADVLDFRMSPAKCAVLQSGRKTHCVSGAVTNWSVLRTFLLSIVPCSSCPEQSRSKWF